MRKKARILALLFFAIPWVGYAQECPPGPFMCAPWGPGTGPVGPNPIPLPPPPFFEVEYWRYPAPDSSGTLPRARNNPYAGFGNIEIERRFNLPHNSNGYLMGGFYKFSEPPQGVGGYYQNEFGLRR